MSKKLIILVSILLVLSIAGYYAYTRWDEARQKVDLWTLVPNDAVFIIESNNHKAFIEHLKTTEIWRNLSRIPYIRSLEENLQLLDSLSARGNTVPSFLENKNIITSAHVLGSSGFSYVYYIPVNTVDEHRFVRRLVENMNKSTIFRQDFREYQGYQIIDFTNVEDGGTFSYFSYHNNLIISPAPVLVEEVIRRVNKGELESVAKEYENTNYLAQPDVYANVFINYRNLPAFLKLFFKEEIHPELNYLTSLCRNSMLEFKLQSNKIFLNGFSNPRETEGSLYQQLKGQQPKPLNVIEYMPNRTAMLLHFSLEEIKRLRDTSQNKLLLEKYAIDPVVIDSLAATFENEVALAYLEAYNVNSIPAKVVMAHSAAPARTTAFLQELAGLAVAATGDSPQEEKYGPYRIRLVNLPELPRQLFGRVFAGFEQVYVTQVKEYTIFASDVATVRTVLEDIEKQNVWGKSALQQLFLEETQHEANFSVFLNTINAWYLLNRYFTEDMREAQLQNASLLKKFNLFSSQFSLNDGQYYTSFLLKHQEVGNEKNKSQQVIVTQTVNLPTRLIDAPYLVKDPVNKSQEVIVQDSAFALHNINSTGKVTWRDSLSSAIAGDIYQLAFGGSQQPRYLFATANRIYCLDRNGNDVENFPFTLGDSLRIQNLSVFDYDKSGDYRLLVDDYLGNLYMLDLRGNILPGWQPLQLDYRLAVPPRHYKVNGRDVILVILENGYVYALSPEGDSYPGFPISLRSTVTSPAFAKLGSTFRNSEFTVVTQQGEVVVFNLLGDELKREQLLRSSRRAVFDLILESEEKSFIISRQDLGRVALFDQDLQLIMEKSFVTASPKIVQYFHFGGDDRVFAITETGPQKAYLFDQKGQLIGNKKIDNYFPLRIRYNERGDQYEIYQTYQRQYRKLTF